MTRLNVVRLPAGRLLGTRRSAPDAAQDVRVLAEPDFIE